MWNHSKKNRSLLVVCVLLGRTLAQVILQEVFNYLNFTVKVVSQVEHVSAQGEKILTWFLFSDVAQFFTYTISLVYILVYILYPYPIHILKTT